jgi:hypothetical protein
MYGPFDCLFGGYFRDTRTKDKEEKEENEATEAAETRAVNPYVFELSIAYLSDSIQSHFKGGSHNCWHSIKMIQNDEIERSEVKQFW